MPRPPRSRFLLPALLLALAPALRAGDGEAACCDACGNWSASGETIVQRVVDGVVPASFCAAMDAGYAERARRHPAWFYAQTLAARPGERDAVLALLRQRFTAPGADAGQRGRILDFACQAPKEAAKTIVPDLWKASRKSFTTDHLLALAPYAEDLERDLAARAPKEVAAAAWFALRGEATGKALLKSTYQKADAKDGTILPGAVAALGLQALGDEEAVAKLVARTHAAVVAALDAHDLERARRLALEAEWLSRTARRGKAVELGWVADQVDEHVQARAPKLESEAAVFDLVEAVRTASA